MPEVVTLPQQWFTKVGRQRVGEAVSEVQTGGMPAALAEVGVGLSSQASLSFSNRLDDKAGFGEEFIERSADERITLGVENYPAFEVGGRG